MPRCLFVSDLHGRVDRYEKLFAVVRARRPAAVFLGGDLLPSAMLAAASGSFSEGAFLATYLAEHLRRLRAALRDEYPALFVVLGNDDAGIEEASVLDIAAAGLWEYVHGRSASWAARVVYGYGCVPPTPYLLKDWERYDVSRFVDVGCVAPEEGYRTVPISEWEARNATIQGDLDRLAGSADLARSIWLFHAPPYQTAVDRAALDGKMVDHAPRDVHVGSIAIRRFIERRQPLVTLHGHVHESARLTGEWRERIGRTWALSAAHDGPELAVVSFDPDKPEAAARELL